MTRYTPIDLAAYPVTDILESLSFEAYLARDRAEFTARWEARRAVDPTLPPLDAIGLDSDPSSLILQIGAYRETLLRARVNDRARDLTLVGARGRALDHIASTYLRTARRAGEDDETYRQRAALAPESWSTAGPVGAYVWWALSASPDVLDVAVYSEDEGVCLAPEVRVVLLQRLDPTIPDHDGTASAPLIATVRDALRRSDIRPLGDLVTVESCAPLPYDLTIVLRVRSGVSASTVAARAEARLRAYCDGRLRWAGDDVPGPVWLIGRTLGVETLAAIAMGGDPNIFSVDVLGADINPPAPGYTPDALARVGTADFQPLPRDDVAHLFRAPRLRSLTVTAQALSPGWTG